MYIGRVLIKHYLDKKAMGKRILMWIIPFAAGLFACQEGYWIVGMVMLSWSVGYVFWWGFRIFREWIKTEKHIHVSFREIINTLIVLSIFIVLAYFNVSWIGWIVVAFVVVVRVLRILLTKTGKQ